MDPNTQQPANNTMNEGAAAPQPGQVPDGSGQQGAVPETPQQASTQPSQTGGESSTCMCCKCCTCNDGCDCKSSAGQGQPDDMTMAQPTQPAAM